MPADRGGGVLTRRQFVAAGAAGGVAAAIGCKARRRGDWEFLSNEQARTLGAICDQIVPRDDFPSATEAGVLTFIDRQLVRHFRRHQDAYTAGLKRAEAVSWIRYIKGLTELTASQQLEVVTALSEEDKTFFDLVRNHTLEGYYGAPRHGGNRDGVSWRMLGLDVPPLRGRAQYDLRKEPQS